MYCTNCGAPIPRESATCVQCGARFDYHPGPTPPDFQNPQQTSQQAMPLRSTQQYAAPSQSSCVSQPYIQQTGVATVGTIGPPPPSYNQQANPVYANSFQPVQAASLPENPMRAIILAAALFGAIIISAFFVAGWDETSIYYIECLFIAMIACGAYLAWKPTFMTRIAAGAIAVLGPLAYFLTMAAYRSFTMVLSFDLLALLDSLDFMAFVRSFLFALVIMGIAFGMSFAVRDNQKHRASIMALCCGGAVIVASILSPIISTIPNIAYFFLVVLVGEIPAALAMGLAVRLVFMLCTMRSFDLETRVGHKVWFGICLTFTTISFVVTFLGSVIGSSFFGYSGFVLALLTITGIVGYSQLLASKRIGYLLILLATGAMFFGPLFQGMSVITYTIALGYSVPYQGLTVLASSFASVVNPTITGIVLLFIWKRVPIAKPFAKPSVSVLFKIFAIAGVAIGSALFLVGSSEFFNLYGYQTMRSLPSVSFLLGVVFGAGTLVLGIFAILACFRNESRAPMPLLIANLATTVLSLLFLVLVIAL